MPGKSSKEIFEATLSAANNLSFLLDEYGYFTDEATEKITSKFGILSLSSDPVSTLLWEHYGAGLSGLCIGFDTSIYPMLHAKELIYADTVPIAALGNGASLDNILFFHKSLKSIWEREWRIVKCNPGPFEAGQGIVREVIFGSKCAPEDIEEVKSIIPKNDGCRFCRIVRDRFSYALKAQEI
ncbi:hypothetical protein [Methylobacter svalbardensis]|uniref:hypothetical protein n=1 Tax=Methylobacter svalbardensis TaxID=3080016 RepID=UPI0030EF975B